MNISGSDMDNSRSKPYRIRIPSGTTKRHEKSFESSASETEVKLNGRATNLINMKKHNPLEIKSNKHEYYHPYAQQPTPFEKS